MRYKYILSIVLLTGVLSFIYMANEIGTNSFKHPLHYYTNIDDDSLKLEAAKFLLENIPYHYSNGNVEGYCHDWEQWRASTDTILLALQAEYGYNTVPHGVIDSIRAVRDTALVSSVLPASTALHAITCDSNVVTGEFLIRHIDNAFKVWRSSKLAQKLTFDEFKEYILPYTPLQYYGFINSGKSLNDIFAPFLCVDTAATITELIERYNNTISALRNLNGLNRRNAPAGLYDLYVHGIHECTDIAVWGSNILRACGIPTVVENVIGYRDFAGKHFHCSLYDTDSGKWHPFNAESSLPGNFSFENPKCLNVYRHLYSAQKENPYFRRNKNEPIPEEFSNPCIKDVTSEYLNVYSVSLPCDTNITNNLAYLATFNAHNGIKVTTWGVVDTTTNLITFENALPEVLYLPVYYTKEGYKSFSFPFYLSVKDGKAIIMTLPSINSETATTTLYLTRKFPRKESMKHVAEELVGGTFIGSNDYDFKNSKILYTITEAPLPILKEYKFKKTGKYRYYRFQSPSKSPHANISHLEWVTVKSYGYENIETVSRTHILSPEEKYNAINDNKFVKLLDRDRNRMTWASEYDGNMQTAPGVYPNITLSLDEPQIVTAVRFSPLNADNGIKSGNLYELYYWNNGWQSCGRQVAEYEYLKFENVPANKLYWLKNHTEGKEEMPFIFVDGKQIFIYDGVIVQGN